MDVVGDLGTLQEPIVAVVVARTIINLPPIFCPILDLPGRESIISSTVSGTRLLI